MDFEIEKSRFLVTERVLRPLELRKFFETGKIYEHSKYGKIIKDVHIQDKTETKRLLSLKLLQSFFPNIGEILIKYLKKQYKSIRILR